MFKLQKFVFAMMITLFAVGAQAQGKIAVLDIDRAIINSDLFKARMQAFNEQADTVAARKQVESMQAEGQKLNEQLQNDAAILSDEQKVEMQKKIQTLMADIQHEAKKFQAAQQNVIAEVQREINPRVRQVIDTLVKEEGIGLLMGRPTHPQIPQLNQVIMYMDSSYDITAKVTDRLNKAQ